MLWKIYFWFLALILAFTYIAILAGKVFSFIVLIDFCISLPSILGFFLYVHKKILFNAKFWKIYVPIYYVWDIGFNLYIAPRMAPNIYHVNIPLQMITGFALVIPMWIALFFYAYKFRNKYKTQAEVDAAMGEKRSVKKGCLIAAISVFLIIAFFIAAIVFWVFRNKDKFIAEDNKANEEAKQFAASSDSQGCLHEALVRANNSNGVMAQAGTVIFVDKCLESAKYTPGFCDNMPKDEGLIKIAMWAAQQCTDNANPRMCAKLWSKAEEFCAKRK